MRHTTFCLLSMCVYVCVGVLYCGKDGSYISIEDNKIMYVGVFEGVFNLLKCDSLVAFPGFC